MSNQITIKERLRLLVKGAKARDIEVHINEELYKDTIEDGCSYCGESLIDKTGICVDRICNDKGYFHANIAACCRTCNTAKNAMKDENEFFDWISKVYKHRQKFLSNVEYANKHIGKKQIKKDMNIYVNSSRIRNSKTVTYKSETSKKKVP